MNDEKYIAELRQLFPVTENWTYLYNGGVHPCPRPVGDAMRAFISRWETGGRAGCNQAFEAFGELREKFGELLHTKARNIVITESTTAGINMAAQIIRPDLSQNIVVTDLEFMSDTYPWIVCHPAQVRFARSRNGKIRPEDISDLVDDHTAAISVSAVTVSSGFRTDLTGMQAIARQFNIPLIVDAAQALGLIDVNVNEIEPGFLVSTASKWLMGPTGVGFLYVADQYLNVTPPAVGWFAAANRNDWNLQVCDLYNDARRFQGGIPNLAGIVGALAGIKLIEQIGQEFIERRVLELTGYAIEGLESIGVDILTPRKAEERAGIVFFRIQDSKGLFNKLKEEHIYCGSFLSGIRIDPNFYNTFEEIEKFLHVVRKHAIKAYESTIPVNNIVPIPVSPEKF
jgi:selenocysteine lyase/cysteine desulfurase